MLPELDVTDLPPDAVEVGRVGEAWGIKGWFKVLAHSSAPEAIFSSKRWYLAPAERGTRGFEGHRLLRLVEVKEHAGGIVAQAQAIQDRTAAEKLRGARVFIARGSFPSTGPDEHYWVDLIGLQVINREGLPLGQVRDLLSTAAQAVLVLEFQQDGQTHERMIPFVSAYVDQVDQAGGRILVDWQPDY
ncbi:MAG: ribosome maturation factor RimM [Rhodoferax sp.]|nr:ribosome maturation factor RimM [Rhodoferax sp.]